MHRAERRGRAAATRGNAAQAKGGPAGWLAHTVAMAKVGVIGFGGGSALIPVMEKELVKDRLLRPGEFVQDTVIANITPGALPVKLAALSGARLSGARLAVSGALVVALPGVLATVALLAFFAQLGPNVVRGIEFASLGITAFILYLLGHYVVKVIKSHAGGVVAPIVIAVVAFLVSGLGKSVELGFGVAGVESPWVLPELSALGLVLLALVAISVFSLWRYLRRHRVDDPGAGNARPGQTRRALRAAVVLAVLTAASVAVVVLVAGSGDPLAFFGLILASTATSFGGGEAYVGVADGFFVATGLVEPSVFYGQVVPIANALPGPILVKIASGVAFLMGGWGFATVAFVVAVASCSAIAVGVLAGYDRARNSLLVHNISTYILPVICGLLASTAVSMLQSNARIGSEAGVAPVITIAASVAAAASVALLHRWVRVPDIAVILVFGAISFGALSAVAG